MVEMRKRPYVCSTQDGLMPTIASAPGGKATGGSGHGDRLVLGNKERIPRWTANKTTPTKLLYFVVPDGFAAGDQAYAATAFQAAAKQWNDIKIGVEISATTNKSAANFLVTYYKPDPNGPNWENEKDTVARAFFPNQVTKVLVFDLGLTDADERKYLMNTFLHEIGHILGLRHEFALDIRTEGPKKGQMRESVGTRFGSVNPHSVMSYDAVNYINETDIKDVKAFYELPNGKKLLNVVDVEVPVTDYTPQLLGS